MTGKEYHMLQQLVDHFDRSAKQCHADAKTRLTNKADLAEVVNLEGKGDGFFSCADQLKQLLASMNS